jgi:tetratricopeptide (TPR) repeat protein
MAIRGNLSEASLADVLQLLALGQKTGVLSLARDDSFGAVHFDRGAIWHAAIVNHRDRLGDRLVRSGAIDADQLASIEATLGAADDARLARHLADRRTVELELLHREYRLLVEEVVCQLFTWSAGTFAFEPCAAQDVPLLALPADALLMEAARRVDEWTQIAKKIPSLDLLFEVDGARLQQSGLAVTDEQARILPWLDGTHDVASIIERSGLGEFTVGKTLYGLVTAGFAQRVGRSAARRQPAPESRVAEHRNLGVAFYRTGMYEEARREFRRVLELRADDQGARYQLALVHLRLREWSEAIALLRAAVAQPDATPALHHALGYALECDGQLDAAEAALAEAVRGDGASDPRLALSQAVVALRRGDLPRAEERLSTSRAWWGARQPTAVWFHYAGLAAAMRGELDRALHLLEEGITLHPHAIGLHNDLAVVQERRGLQEAAARTLEHALLEASSVPHLHKNLGDYLYRAQRFEEAHDSYERVVRLDAAHGPDTWLKLGNIRYRLGDLAGARAAWESAIALDPAHAIARANLGRTATAAGRSAEQVGTADATSAAGSVTAPSFDAASSAQRPEAEGAHASVADATAAGSAA